MRSLVRSCAGILVFYVIGVNPAWGSFEVTPEALQFFEAKIRPVLVERCYRCHQDKQRGGLRVDSREGLVTGGDSGPAIDVDKPESSFLLKAIRHEGDDLAKMPPDKKLPQTQIDDLARWVKMGAPWPETTSAKTPAKGREAFRVTDADRAAWAFRKLVKPEIPKVADASAIANPIDAFLLERLEANGLHLNPAASKRDLLRRLSYDLIGLPPTPEELLAFEQDPSSDAYERQVDRLLGLPRYGERWGRHWLDVVRFAQTNGYERDDEKPFAWRYRDYVIQAFNEDKPYDRFIANSSRATSSLPGPPRPRWPPASIGSAPGTTKPTTCARPVSTTSTTSSEPPPRPFSA